jgi:large subunit ribosomal protein L16
MLFPKRTKHRKKQKGNLKGKAKAGTLIEFGEFGIQVLDRGWITSKQIEAARIAINRFLTRRGKVWIKIFPDKPISKKPAETRMGKGKGAPSEWVAAVRPGRILFEVADIAKEEAQSALRRAAAKLPLKTRFVERMEQIG